jgi:hypothetical protein
MTEDQVKAIIEVHKILDRLNIRIHQGIAIEDNTELLRMMEILSVQFQEEICGE